MNFSAPMDCPASADNVFGPLVAECRRAFDFTALFEDSFLSIVPSSILLLLAPIRLITLYGKRRTVGGQSFRIAKLLTIVALAVLQTALLVLWCLYSTERTRATIASAALSAVDAVIFCLLSYGEHALSIRPSALLNIYLFFSVLFDAVRARTLWLMNYDPTIRAVFTATLALKVIILFLEVTEKRRFLRVEDRKLSPEETSGILNQSLFVWLNQLIVTGFKKVLLMDDLYPLNQELSTSHLKVKFRKDWNLARHQQEPKLFLTLSKTLKWQLLAPAPGRLCLVAFTLIQPLLLDRFISYLQEPQNKNSANYGHGLILAYGLVYIGMAISTGFYWHRVYRSLTMIRGILVSAIYDKTMEISITALENSQAVSLMSTDIQQIVDGLKFVHEIWANLLQVAVATWLLSRQIGVACVAPVGVSLVSTVLIGGVAAIAGPRQALWMKALEKRVGITATMLSSMSGVKMTGLTPRLSILIQKLRIDEIRSGTKFRHALVYALTLGFSPQILAPVLSFGIFIAKSTADGVTLDSTRMFTSLSLILILTTPLSQTLQSVPQLMGALSCIDRVQIFLLSKARVDHRTLTVVDDGDRSDPSVNYEAKNKLSDEIHLATFASSGRTLTPEKSFKFNTDDLSEIEVHDCTFGWTLEGKQVLNDISLNILRSKMTMIIGPVGCGKSTLLKGLLGETLFSEGSVRISSASVAFCDQTPWLINATIQDNIVGFSDFNAKWYESVVRACVLRSDFDVFPKGDKTMVGSKGITLSGGQKQRVAIARAVYARKDIAIFDDVFSSLDAGTQQLLFSRVFGADGLLRSRETTVVMVTHAVSLLPHADHIISLDADGTIAAQGPFDDINQQGGYIYNFESKLGQELVDAAAPKTEQTLQDLPVDESNRGNGDFSIYVYYFRTIGLPAMITFFLGLAAFAFLSTFPTIWLKWWSDYTVEHPFQNNGYYLGIYAAFQGGALLSIAFVGWLTCSILIVASGSKLHRILLDTIMNAPMSFFANTDLGVTTNRVSQDIRLVDSELPISLLDLTAGVLVTISQAGLIATSSKYVAISYPVLLLAFFFLQRFYLRTSRQLRLMDLEAKSPLYSQFLESLSGLATLRAFGWQQENQTLNDELLDTSQRPFYLLYMIQRWLTLILDLISASLAVTVVTIAVEMRTTSSPGFTGVALVNIISFADYLKYLIVVWTNLETALGAVSRIKTFNETTEVEHRPEENMPPPDYWPKNGQIEFRKVSAAYNTSNNNVLNNLNLLIHAGEKIGICGRSGSGKSSLILALFRMIELNTGCILVDDIDISTLPREEVRAGLIAIPQEPYFLTGTVRLNADPFCNATDEAVTEALTKVGLWDNLGGLDVDFDMDMLSHGQRQLFCLARAMLCGSKIVVLDEATSSVDSETDKLMQRLIREEFANRTIIAVAHRLSTILDFDRVVVLEEGIIVECNSPKDLLARQSAFRALYDQYDSRKGEEADEDVDEVTPDIVEDNMWDETEVETLPTDRTPENPRNEVEDDGLEVGEFQLHEDQLHNYTPMNEGEEGSEEVVHIPTNEGNEEVEEEVEDEVTIEQTDRNDEIAEEEEGIEAATEGSNKRTSIGWLRRMISNEQFGDPDASGSSISFEVLGGTIDGEESTHQDQL